MLFKYNREDGPKRIAGLSGHICVVGSEWKEIPKSLWGDAKNTPGIDFKSVVSKEAVIENEAITTKVYKALKDEEIRSRVITKTGKVSSVAMREEIGVQAQKHVLESQWSKVKEELGL